MNTAFYTSGVSMLQQQKALDVVANNFANVSTHGFKASRANFADLMYTHDEATPPQDNTIGHGAKVGRVQLLFETGTPSQTQVPTDFFAPADTLFAVQAPDAEEPYYTRAGAFQLQVNDDEVAVVTSEGYAVLDVDGSPIMLEHNDDGSVNYTNLENNLGLYWFNNPAGLSQEGANSFSATELSGEAEQVRTESLSPMQGFLETSNVDTATEMSKMIVAQRAFQFNSRMVQAADEIAQTVNSLR